VFAVDNSEKSRRGDLGEKPGPTKKTRSASEKTKKDKRSGSTDDVEMLAISLPACPGGGETKNPYDLYL